MRKSLFVLILSILFSCRNDEEIPAGVLSKEKMEDLMLDLARADQYVSGFKPTDSTHDQKAETIKVYQEVFLLHRTTKQDFEKSLAYYQARPEILKVMFDTLNARQQRQQSDSYNRYSGQDSAKKKKPIFQRPTQRD